MKIYDRVKIRERAAKHVISGLDPTGFLVVLTASSLIILIPLAYSFFFYSVHWTSPEVLFVMIFLLLAGLFGFGYKVVITHEELKFYETYFFIPICRIRDNINNVQVITTLAKQDEINNLPVIIEWQDDPWAEMGFSDWVAIRKDGKEYCFGGNNNYRQLLDQIEKSVLEMRKPKIVSS